MKISELQKLLKKSILISDNTKNNIITKWDKIDIEVQKMIIVGITESIELQDLLSYSAYKKEKDFDKILAQKINMIQKNIFLESEKKEKGEQNEEILSNWP